MSLYLRKLRLSLAVDKREIALPCGTVCFIILVGRNIMAEKTQELFGISGYRFKPEYKNVELQSRDERGSEDLIHTSEIAEPHQQQCDEWRVGHTR